MQIDASAQASKPRSLYTLWPKQREAMALLGMGPDWQARRHTAVTELLYGGEAGGGKSRLVRVLAATVATIWPGSRFAIFRRTYPELDETHSMPLQQEWEGLGTYNQERREFRWWNGSTTVLRYAEHEGDVVRYQSAEWAGFALDEATHFTGFQLEFLRSRVRVPRHLAPWAPLWRPVMLYTANPGNVGHLYFKANYVDPDPRGGRILAVPEEEGGGRRCFLRARLQDNPSLGAGYRKRIAGIKDEALRKALLEGDWNIFAGQYFGQWRTELHTIEPFPIPSSWPRRAVSVDYGYGAPFSAHFYVRDEDLLRQEKITRWYVYRELYGAGVLDTDQAAAIVEGVALDKGGSARVRLGTTPVYDYVGDPSMWAVKQVNGAPAVSVASVYRQHGVPLVKANNDRLNGWARVREYLAPQPDGYPGVIYFDTCTEAIRTIPALIRDKKRPEDVDTTGEDHAADELRYACMHFGELQRSAARGQQGRRYGVKTARTTAPNAARHQTLPPAVNVPQGPGRGRDVFERALANARGQYAPSKKLRDMGYK